MLNDNKYSNDAEDRLVDLFKIVKNKNKRMIVLTSMKVNDFLEIEHWKDVKAGTGADFKILTLCR